MNIKIVDPLPSHLVEFTIPFGSKVYGTDNKDSDSDYVVLTHDSFSLGDATLQWSGIMPHGEKVDLTYVDKVYFFYSAVDGKNTVMFEAMHNPLVMVKFKASEKFLLDEFYNYENAKAYLGLAKRDLDYPDRIFHVNRCLWMSEKIMNKSFIDLSEIKNIPVETNTELLRFLIQQRREQLMKMWKKT